MSGLSSRIRASASLPFFALADQFGIGNAGDCQFEAVERDGFVVGKQDADHAVFSDVSQFLVPRQADHTAPATLGSAFQRAAVESCAVAIERGEALAGVREADAEPGGRGRATRRRRLPPAAPGRRPWRCAPITISTGSSEPPRPYFKRVLDQRQQDQAGHQRLRRNRPGCPR